MEEQEIHKICKVYNISNYTINPDGSIDVDGNLTIINRNLTTIPIKFNKVSGSFDCSWNNLISLENSPIEVGGDFICDFNRLKSLVGSPIKIGGYLYCIGYELESLDGLSISYDKLRYFNLNSVELIRNHKRKKNLKIINQL